MITKEVKTIEEWLCQLPPEIRNKAIANTTITDLKKQVSSLDKAIIDAFTWDITPEGENYWDEIYIKARNNHYNTIIKTEPSYNIY